MKDKLSKRGTKMARFAKVNIPSGAEIEVNVDMIAYVENLGADKSRVHFGPTFAVETTRPARYFKKVLNSPQAQPEAQPTETKLARLGPGPQRQRDRLNRRPVSY
jgi:hypothetical protein